jgi:2-polyprenyl-3-methyl-5-hydroxy-6-metoxy-1,4-benzoquinol methylase
VWTLTIDWGEMMNISEIVCPLCGSQRCELFHDFRVFQLCKCRDCSVIFQPYGTDFELSEELIAAVYDENWVRMREQAEMKTLEEHADFNLALLRIFLAPTSNILEIGSGTGEFLYLANQSGFKITGIEPSANACKYVFNKYGIEMINSRANFKKIVFPDKFDAICFWHVLEHIPHPTKFLVELKELLNPGGFLLFSVPNQHSFTNEIHGFYSPLFQEIDHLFHYNVITSKIFLIYCKDFLEAGDNFFP